MYSCWHCSTFILDGFIHVLYSVSYNSPYSLCSLYKGPSSIVCIAALATLVVAVVNSLAQDTRTSDPPKWLLQVFACRSAPLTEDFELWIRRFKTYCIGAKVADGLKCYVLLAALDDDDSELLMP